MGQRHDARKQNVNEVQMRTLRVREVGYSRLGFEYFLHGFAPALVPTKLMTDSDKSSRAAPI